jgi:hypothetical protein
MSEPRRRVEVDIGGQVRTVEKFTGRKVAVSLKVVGRLASTYHDFSGEITAFKERYAVEHPVRLTKGQVYLSIADLEGAIGNARATEDEDVDENLRRMVIESLMSTKNAYQNLLDGPLKDADFVERPGIASAEELFMGVAAKVLVEDEVENEVAQLIGLTLMSNREVGEARRVGTLNERMQEIGDEALDTVDIDELIDLLLAAGEMLLGDMKDRKERLGKILALFRPAAEEQSVVEAPQEPEPTSTSTDGKPIGSIDSEQPTDGQQTIPLTESPTASASA